MRRHSVTSRKFAPRIPKKTQLHGEVGSPFRKLTTRQLFILNRLDSVIRTMEMLFSCPNSLWSSIDRWVYFEHAKAFLNEACEVSVLANF